MTRTVRIDRKWLWSTLMELKEIGAYGDRPPGCAACAGSR
jgi:hypothetical protein